MSRPPEPQPTLRDELAQARNEPLLPIERKLIGWSLGIGIVSLAVLVILTRLL